MNWLLWFILGIAFGFFITIVIATISAYKQIKFEKSLNNETIDTLTKNKKGE